MNSSQTAILPIIYNKQCTAVLTIHYNTLQCKRILKS